MTQPPVWVDGELVAAAEATVSVFDHGLTVGDGAFETLKVNAGVPFAVHLHLRRLERSVDLLGLGPLPDEAVLRQAMADVIAGATAGGAEVGRLRVTVTGGAGPLGSGRDGGPLTVVVAGGPGGTWAPAAAVATVPWTRNERGALAGVKSTSYADNVIALARAHAEGASEAVFANTVGALCEGTGSNVFVAVDGRLATPPLSSGCLAGITRDLVLRVTGAVEHDLPLEALAGAEEAFLTSSTRDVQPISAVDGRRLPAAPGPLTRDAIDAFARLVAEDPDPR